MNLNSEEKKRYEKEAKLHEPAVENKIEVAVSNSANTANIASMVKGGPVKEEVIVVNIDMKELQNKKEKANDIFKQSMLR